MVQKVSGLAGYAARLGTRRHAKRFRDGTHRAVSPGETLARLRPHLAEMGITRIANVTGLDRIGIPVVTVTRPNARSVAVAQGKGATLEAAKASAVMEAVETHHAERVDLPLMFCSWAELAERHPVVPVDRLPEIRDSRFRPDLRTLWVEGRDIAGDRPVWLPFETVHTDFRVPFPPGSGSFVASTNGLASGNHLMEAICHALYEVIERDAVALWNRRSLAARRASRIDLAGLPEGEAARAAAQIERAGFALALWDTTSDVGIPCTFAMLCDPEEPEAHPGIGAGCHPSAGVAAIRAIAEAVQVRSTYITGARDDLTRAEFLPAARADRADRARMLMGGDAPHTFAALPGVEHETFEEDLEWALDRLRGTGVSEVVVVDLSRPGIDAAVARVVVPGLEGADDSEDYVPGPRARQIDQASP